MSGGFKVSEFKEGKFQSGGLNQKQQELLKTIISKFNKTIDTKLSNSTIKIDATKLHNYNKELYQQFNNLVNNIIKLLTKLEQRYTYIRNKIDECLNNTSHTTDLTNVIDENKGKLEELTKENSGMDDIINSLKEGSSAALSGNVPSVKSHANLKEQPRSLIKSTSASAIVPGRSVLHTTSGMSTSASTHLERSTSHNPLGHTALPSTSVPERVTPHTQRRRFTSESPHEPGHATPSTHPGRSTSAPTHEPGHATPSTHLERFTSAPTHEPGHATPSTHLGRFTSAPTHEPEHATPSTHPERSTSAPTHGLGPGRAPSTTKKRAPSTTKILTPFKPVITPYGFNQTSNLNLSSRRGHTNKLQIGGLSNKQKDDFNRLVLENNIIYNNIKNIKKNNETDKEKIIEEFNKSNNIIIQNFDEMVILALAIFTKINEKIKIASDILNDCYNKNISDPSNISNIFVLDKETSKEVDDATNIAHEFTTQIGGLNKDQKDKLQKIIDNFNLKIDINAENIPTSYNYEVLIKFNKDLYDEFNKLVKYIIDILTILDNRYQEIIIKIKECNENKGKPIDLSPIIENEGNKELYGELIKENEAMEEIYNSLNTPPLNPSAELDVEGSPQESTEEQLSGMERSTEQPEQSTTEQPEQSGPSQELPVGQFEQSTEQPELPELPTRTHFEHPTGQTYNETPGLQRPSDLNLPRGGQIGGKLRQYDTQKITTKLQSGGLNQAQIKLFNTLVTKNNELFKSITSLKRNENINVNYDLIIKEFNESNDTIITNFGKMVDLAIKFFENINKKIQNAVNILEKCYGQKQTSVSPTKFFVDDSGKKTGEETTREVKDAEEIFNNFLQIQIQKGGFNKNIQLGGLTQTQKDELTKIITKFTESINESKKEGSPQNYVDLVIFNKNLYDQFDILINKIIELLQVLQNRYENILKDIEFCKSNSSNIDFNNVNIQKNQYEHLHHENIYFENIMNRLSHVPDPQEQQGSVPVQEPVSAQGPVSSQKPVLEQPQSTPTTSSKQKRKRGSPNGKGSKWVSPKEKGRKRGSPKGKGSKWVSPKGQKSKLVSPKGQESKRGSPKGQEQEQGRRHNIQQPKK